MKKQKNYAFIDSQNLNLGIQKMGWKLDWRKFRELLSKKYNVEHAYMFIGYMQENEALYEQMHDLGYRIVLKPTVEQQPAHVDTAPRENSNSAEDAPHQLASADARKGVKGNTDADLVLYALKEMPHYDKAIIVSGDGDFFSTVEYLIAENKLLNLMTPNWQYSSLLKQFEPFIVRLDLMKRQLAYRTYQKKSKK